MITVNPEAVANLVSNHNPFDLIDVRPKEEFNRLHILGARSAPLQKMSPVKLLRERKLAASEPFFIISENRALAGMAAGLLRGAGCSQPVVVEGGMANWEARGLPAVPRRRFHF